MAILNIPDKEITTQNTDEIAEYLRDASIDYERWPVREIPPTATESEILAVFSFEIAALKSKFEYVAADVIDLTPDTPGLETMLDKFNKEHWHDDDEVRFAVSGRGLFHIAPPDADIFSIEIGSGDLIRIPGGTLHWFDLCSDRTIRAIRLFRDPAGWIPNYAKSGLDAKYQPLSPGD